MMRRYFWVLLNLTLLGIVLQQVWSYQSCQVMYSQSDCRRYSAGCGMLCTASVPISNRYTCCCDVYCSFTAQVIGCCEAECIVWACEYILIGTNCGWDVDFGAPIGGNPQVSYLHNSACIRVPGGEPMEGICLRASPIPGPPPTPGPEE